MVNPNANAQTPATVQIPLPPGVTPEEFAKSLKTFQKFESAVKVAKLRDKALRAAFTAIKEKYPKEWKALLDAELKKLGLPPTK